MNLVESIFCTGIDVLIVIIFLSAILTWFPTQPGTNFYKLSNSLNSITRPIYGPFRKFIPPIGGGEVRIDITPVLIIVFLEVLSRLVC
jgi:uncharacterized protein YggT (Ycf19 family)